MKFYAVIGEKRYETDTFTAAAVAVMEHGDGHVEDEDGKEWFTISGFLKPKSQEAPKPSCRRCGAKVSEQEFKDQLGFCKDCDGLFGGGQGRSAKEVEESSVNVAICIIGGLASLLLAGAWALVKAVV